MDLTEARELAAGLMARHRLTDWHLTFDDAKTRAGVCRPARKEIGLSRPLIRLYSPEQVTETVLHEIAHALAGPGHGHDRKWRTIAAGGLSGLTNIATANAASVALNSGGNLASVASLDDAIKNVSTIRGEFGAAQNRLEHRLNNLATYQENLVASESRIRDVDMASEMVNFTKLQILQQAGTSMLAQANQAPQSVLSLLH